MTTIEISVTPVAGPLDLYHRYSGQTQPQRTFVVLDLRTGRLSADWDAQIGGGVPETVWNGAVQRWPISAPLRARGANALLDVIAPLAARVLAGVIEPSDYYADRRWRLTEDGREASSEIEDICNDLAFLDPVSDYVQAWDARDWFGGESRDQTARRYGITGYTTDVHISAMANGTGLEDEVDVIEGLHEYLLDLRDTRTVQPNAVVLDYYESGTAKEIHQLAARFENGNDLLEDLADSCLAENPDAMAAAEAAIRTQV